MVAAGGVATASGFLFDTSVVIAAFLLEAVKPPTCPRLLTAGQRRTMHIRYDREVDALGILFREATVTTKIPSDGIIAEYDAEDRPVGLEILDAGACSGGPFTFRVVTPEGTGLAETRGNQGLGES